MRRTTALAACALAGSLAMPANATGWVPSSGTGPGTVAITITGAYSGVLVNGLQVAATCEAVAVGVVAVIVIDQCYITANGIQHPSVAPLNATASAFVEQVNTLDFTLCYHAYAIPQLDPLNPASAGGCADGLPGIGGLGGGFGTN